MKTIEVIEQPDMMDVAMPCSLCVEAATQKGQVIQVVVAERAMSLQ